MLTATYSIGQDTLVILPDVEEGICGVGLKYPRTKQFHRRIISELGYSAFHGLEDSLLVVKFSIHRDGTIGTIEMDTENQEAIDEISDALYRIKHWETVRSDGIKLKSIGILVINLKSE